MPETPFCLASLATAPAKVSALTGLPYIESLLFQSGLECLPHMTVLLNAGILSYNC